MKYKQLHQQHELLHTKKNIQITKKTYSAKPNRFLRFDNIHVRKWFWDFVFMQSIEHQAFEISLITNIRCGYSFI